jgi:ribonuclease HII
MAVIGVDEVGRGCWAGPVVAGAVMLGRPIAGLKDSKKLSKAQREKLTIVIENEALAIGLGWVEPVIVDEIGITAAVGLAMRRAVEAIQLEYDEIIIDGNFNFLSDNPKSMALIKADDSVPAVSAASIVAKVARDNYMTEIAEQYPGYGFEKHVGYGTGFHLAQLKSLGVSELHRKSYKPVKALLVQ